MRFLCTSICSNVESFFSFISLSSASGVPVTIAILTCVGDSLVPSVSVSIATVFSASLLAIAIEPKTKRSINSDLDN